MRTILILVFSVIFPICLKGQFIDSGKLKTVIIGEYNTKNFDSLLFQSVKINFKSSGNTLSTELSGITGIQSYNMGPGNNKLSIRGFSGNRIAIIIDGLKLDNQQWQDEHGLGLFPFSNDVIRVGFGPNVSKSMSESIGGTVDINTQIESSSSNVASSFFSNSLGVNLNWGRNRIYSSGRSKWINFSVSDFGDYHDAKGQDILNSRYRQFQFKTGIESNFIHQVRSKLSLRGYVSQTGIARIIDSNELRQVQLADARDYEGPNHLVSMVIGSIRSVKNCGRYGNLNHTIGFTENTRIEMEDNHPKGLGLQLSTLQHIIRLEQSRLKWLHSFELYTSLQRNYNFGSAKAIPDYSLSENRLNFVGKTSSKSSPFTYSISLNEYNLLNLENKIIIQRISKNWGVYYTYSGQKLNTIIKITHSERVANVHELFANGLSEDAFRFDQGDASLKTEQLNQIDVGISGNFKCFKFIFRSFGGYWNNYIALVSTDNFKNNAPIFQYKAFSGKVLGFENSMEYGLNKLKSSIKCELDFVQFDFSQFMPFAPPSCQKISFQFNQSGQLSSKFPELKLEISNYINLNHPSTKKKETHNYYLVNLKAEKKFSKISIYTYINNLTNNYYIDPMSMLKTIPYRAMGMNIQVGFNYQF